MLGRRQIREKIVQTVYSYHQNPQKIDVLEKNLFFGIGKIYDLYVYELNFLVALKDLAEEQIAIGKNKFFKTEENQNPNQKFIQNEILRQIEENAARKNYSEKHNELRWDIHNELLVKTFQRVIAGKRYKDFMAEKNHNFEEDQKFIGKLFLRYIAENEDFHDYICEKELGWEDDFHIANSMTQKTIGYLKEHEPAHTLLKMIKDDEDEEFASKLLRETILNYEEIEKKVEKKLVNWELDRVSLMDRIILITAISELDFFPITPTKVIINEYIEIAKVFTQEKSQVFINGVLDKYTKEMNRIN
jgi:N utilization substance protein B